MDKEENSGLPTHVPHEETVKQWMAWRHHGSDSLNGH